MLSGHSFARKHDMVKCLRLLTMHELGFKGGKIRVILY